MKRLHYMLVLATASLLAACNMDQYPYSEIASDQYVTDAAAVNNLVVGAYSGLHAVLYNEWALTELRTDNARMRVTGSTSSSNSSTRAPSRPRTNGWATTGTTPMP